MAIIIWFTVETTLGGRYCYPCFIDSETEAQRRSVTCPRSHIEVSAELGEVGSQASILVQPLNFRDWKMTTQKVTCWGLVDYQLLISVTY